MKIYVFKKKEKIGGGVAFPGYGKVPGYYNQLKFIDWHTNLWTAAPVAIIFFNNRLFRDIIPVVIAGFGYDRVRILHLDLPV
jgi:hypothetical protein